MTDRDYNSLKRLFMNQKIKSRGATSKSNNFLNSKSAFVNKKNDDIFININGSLVQRDQAKISVFDSGFLLGDGVWEGIRFHKSVLLFIEDHLNRLFESAKGIPPTNL